MTASAVSTRPAPHGMGQGQFIGLIASLMAVNALAIDTMLPALPKIAGSFGVPNSNQQQWIITAYLLGFGGAQIIYGPLADRFGRKPVLLAGLVIYVASTAICAAAGSLHLMILARVLQGLGSAATRVLAVSIVRDCYSGAQMARVMSFSFLVFLAVPIFAPTIGQIIMLFGPWRWVFGALTIFATGVMIWTIVSLPETLHPEDRIPIEPARLAAALRTVVTNRTAMGYMFAMTMMLGGLFGFINSAQQVFGQVFGIPQTFPILFAIMAGFMALSSLLNARIVERVGTRRVSHAALMIYILCALVHAILALNHLHTLVTFTIVQAGLFFAFGLCVSNFGALAMGPLGHVAGIGSSVQGFISTFGGALLGFVVGQNFDGTLVPLTLGFAGYGVLSLGFVVFAENGRLFGQMQPGLAIDASAAH